MAEKFMCDVFSLAAAGLVRVQRARDWAHCALRGSQGQIRGHAGEQQRKMLAGHSALCSAAGRSGDELICPTEASPPGRAELQFSRP